MTATNAGRILLAYARVCTVTDTMEQFAAVINEAATALDAPETAATAARALFAHRRGNAIRAGRQ